MNFSTLHNASFSERFRGMNNFHTLIFMVEFVNNRATGIDGNNLRVVLTIQYFRQSQPISDTHDMPPRRQLSVDQGWARDVKA